MTHEEDIPPTQRIPEPVQDEMLTAAESWLRSANLTEADREVIMDQTADMAAKLSVFSNALVSSRAAAASRSHSFLEHIKSMILSPTNLAGMSDNPHALMEVAKMLQKSLDSEVAYIDKVSDPARMAALQDARIKTNKTAEAEQSKETDPETMDALGKLPSFKRDKIRQLLKAIEVEDIQGDV